MSALPGYEAPYMANQFGAATGAGGAGAAGTAIAAIEAAANIGLGIANTVINKKNADRNFAAQMEQQFYSRALQERLFAREDTAIQRRMADLKAAGINPLLAASQGAGTGQVVGSSAPQRDRWQIQARAQLMSNLLMAKQYEQVAQGIAESKSRQDSTDVNTAIKLHDLRILGKAGILSTSSSFAKDVADVLNNKDRMLTGARDKLQEIADEKINNVKSSIDSAKNTLSEKGSRMIEAGKSVKSKIRAALDSGKSVKSKIRSALDWWNSSGSPTPTH